MKSPDETHEPADRRTGKNLSFLSIATRWPIVRRAVGYAIVVGAILIAINHGDALLSGEVSSGRLFKMLLTVAVPYCVSTASAVGAIREQEG
jgi:hypothetical protein